ncbi:hypothetical protein V3C99_013530 [Haemonchus contortus]
MKDLPPNSSAYVFPLSVTEKRNYMADLNASCCQQLLSVARIVNNRLWTEYKKSEQNLAGADIYTSVILGLFASIIILLMVRSIKSKESLDEQVVTLLSSMQMRVEHEETLRHRKSMREAKKRAQNLLADIKANSLAKLAAKRARSTSYFSLRSRGQSVASATSHNMNVPAKAPLRTRSYNGVLPSIVVQDELVPSCTPISTRSASRQSSVFSDIQSVFSIDHDTVFQFYDNCANPF